MTGAITLSLDFELGWGVVGNGMWRRREAAGVYRDLRPSLKRFVALLDDLEIPCIWAVVGAMIEAPPDRDLGHLRGSYANRTRAFLATAEQATHDGRDLLDTVLTSRTPHVFGTHGYSHVLFDDADQDEIVLGDDISKATRANEKAGLDHRFFVFPENRAAHFHLFSGSGVEVARMHALNEAAPGQRGNLASRFCASIMRPVSPVTEIPSNDGPILHHASELVNWGENAGRLKRTMTKRRLKLALNRAQGGDHVHFWLHPFDLVATPGLEDFVQNWVKDIAKGRDRGLWSIDAREAARAA